MRVLSAFDDHEIVLVTTDAGCRSESGRRKFHVVTAANRWELLRCAKLALQILWLIARERPDIVFSTGATPGTFAVIFGRLSGARTIWLDSIANADQVSMSGRIARRFSDLWLTQWPHLASADGPEYAGAVL
jgi:UDP-N-acetylglucosamine:LPS N-acetylglucosamine transferase